MSTPIEGDPRMAYPSPGEAALATPAKPGPRAGWLARREALYGYAFISPWLIGLVAFTAGPLLTVFYLGFTEYPILSDPVWVGTRNYQRIFAEDPKFMASLLNTAFYVAIRVPLHLGLAFIFALMLHRTVRGI